MEKIRVQKFLSSAGVCSRRQAEDYILQKKITINNKIAILGDKVDPEKDEIKFNNKVIKQSNEFIYYALNKPVGYTSTVSDPKQKKLVTQLVPKEPKVWPVGRLDKDSKGLMILTNDGELTNLLTHPRYEHQKEYRLTFRIKNLKTPISSQDLGNIINQFSGGVRLQEGLAKCDQVEVFNVDNNSGVIKIDLILHQGWRRQIRRMCEKIGLFVLELKRVRISKFKLGDLSEGKYKIIQRKDITD